MRSIDIQPGSVEPLRGQDEYLIRCGTTDTRVFLRPMRICQLSPQVSTATKSWNITGIVRDSIDSTPLPGASLSIVQQPIVETDASGAFSLTGVRSTDTLQCTYIGYLRKLVPVFDLIKTLDTNGASTREY